MTVTEEDRRADIGEIESEAIREWARELADEYDLEAGHQAAGDYLYVSEYGVLVYECPRGYESDDGLGNDAAFDDAADGRRTGTRLARVCRTAQRRWSAVIGLRYIDPNPPTPDRPREDEFIARVRAHESVKEDWTERHDDRPDDVRREVWHDTLADEPADAIEAEERFIKTRRIRCRTLRWKRGGAT